MRFTPAVETALRSVAYERLVQVAADHRPPQVSGPDRDWHKWLFRPPATQRRTNLHVRIAGRPNQRYPLLFRDYLRTHPIARDAYALIKQHLARYHAADMDAYYAIKDPVCDLIWSTAEEWARTTAWQPAGSCLRANAGRQASGSGGRSGERSLPYNRPAVPLAPRSGTVFTSVLVG